MGGRRRRRGRGEKHRGRGRKGKGRREGGSECARVRACTQPEELEKIKRNNRGKRREPCWRRGSGSGDKVKQQHETLKKEHEKLCQISEPDRCHKCYTSVTGDAVQKPK